MELPQTAIYRQIKRDGYQAAQNGQPRTANPYTPGSKRAQRWDDGWTDGAYGAGDGAAS